VSGSQSPSSAIRCSKKTRKEGRIFKLKVHILCTVHSWENIGYGYASEVWQQVQKGQSASKRSILNSLTIPLIRSVTSGPISEDSTIVSKASLLPEDARRERNSVSGPQSPSSTTNPSKKTCRREGRISSSPLVVGFGSAAGKVVFVRHSVLKFGNRTCTSSMTTALLPTLKETISSHGVSAIRSRTAFRCRFSGSD